MANNVKHHVVFLATSTDEKVRDFNIAAAAKNLPITFFNLKDLVGTLHNTLEDKDSAEQNAWDKFRGAAKKMEECRKDPVAVETFCREHGITRFAPERVWFATEDSGVTMPREIWDNIPEEIFSVLPEEIRERLRRLGQGPGVETAPFLSATLGSSNIRQIIEAGFNEFARKQDYFLSLHELDERLLFKEESVLKIQNMMPTMHESTLNGKAEMVETFPVLTATGVTNNSYSHSPYIHPDQVGGRSSNYAVVFPRRRNPSHKTAAEMGVHYIANHSARSKLLDDLVGQINQQVDREHGVYPANGQDRFELAHDIGAYQDKFTGGKFRPDIFKDEKEALLYKNEQFHIGVINAGHNNRHPALDAAIAHEGSYLKSHIFSAHEEAPAGLSPVDLATFYLSYPERILEKSDGLVLMPDSACPPAEVMTLDEKLYLLQSIVVAKQLITRDKDKPVVIINTDHSWDKAIRIHTELANCQMTKDHALPLAYRFRAANAPKELKAINADVTANGYFSIINRSDYVEGLKAAAFIIKDKSLSYHRTNEPPSKILKEGLPLPPKKGVVAIFCSASSENVPLNHFVSEISCRLASAGKSIICGGGDRYTMGAILDGVKRFRASLAELTNEARKIIGYIAGISTYPIAAAETNTGEMPEEYSYRELTSNIYDRMAKMIVPAETVIVAPGGAGTIQEWMGFNLLKEKMPALFKQKKLVIFDPDLMTDPKHAVSTDDVPTPPSSMQNSVFARVLDVVFENRANHYRFNNQYNRSGTYIVSKVDGVVETCHPSYAAPNHALVG